MVGEKKIFSLAFNKNSAFHSIMNVCKKKKKVEGTAFITMSPKKKKKEKSQILSELIPVSADISKYC